MKPYLHPDAREAMIELSYEGFTIFDAGATILFESRSNERITGYPAEECVGRSLFDFIHPEDAERLAPRFSRLAGLPGEMDGDIVRWRHRDGHWIHLEGMVVNQLDNRHIRGMINTFHDVTARVEAEAALKAAKEAAEAVQEKQQRFLAMLSHELRTPLTLIKQPLEALLPAESQDPHWGMVARGLRRLESLVDELVDFTVLDSGQARLRVREAAVGRLLEEWVAEMRPLAQTRGMEIVLEPGDPALRAFLDPGKVSKVLLNLLGNALKFAPVGSTVRVRHRAGGGGAGMPGRLRLRSKTTGNRFRKKRGSVSSNAFIKSSPGTPGDGRAWGWGSALPRRWWRCMEGRSGCGRIGGAETVSGSACPWGRIISPRRNSPWKTPLVFRPLHPGRSGRIHAPRPGRPPPPRRTEPRESGCSSSRITRT